MGLFSKLFGKTDEGGKLDLSPEQFIQTPYVQHALKRYQKRAVILNPRTTAGPINPKLSKFGGAPNLNGLDTYPCCDVCDRPLNFVLQLYQRDFPEHYYPKGKDLFQLFRCPNSTCPDAYSEPFLAGHKMFVYYCR
ncbi:YwqG family protein [Mucilaginibacter gracilis]|uniref:hypothetical protein n=1 Tax=Mucilaginibacter gracilis TaxID=423350 RepID=UPI0013C29FEA|nr:hypothetical protein [Mucilaginibacter gracilis]